MNKLFHMIEMIYLKEFVLITKALKMKTTTNNFETVWCNDCEILKGRSLCYQFNLFFHHILITNSVTLYTFTWASNYYH